MLNSSPWPPSSPIRLSKLPSCSAHLYLLSFRYSPDPELRKMLYGSYQGSTLITKGKLGRALADLVSCKGNKLLPVNSIIDREIWALKKLRRRQFLSVSIYVLVSSNLCLPPTQVALLLPPFPLLAHGYLALIVRAPSSCFSFSNKPFGICTGNRVTAH